MGHKLSLLIKQYMHPKVSIIVPVYNVEKYLSQCVKSLLGQTLKDIEIILVNDKSPDKSPMLCENYASKYPNIQVIHKKENQGLGMACNTGLEIAKGEYVAFCDSDDFIDDNMYSTLYNIANYYHCDAVFSGLKQVDLEGNFIANISHHTKLTFYQGKSQIKSLIQDMIASQPKEKEERKIQVSAKVVLYKRSIIKDNHIRFMSERIYPSEDLLFNIDFLVKSNSICISPYTFYNYRTNPLSISHTLKKDKFNLYKALYLELIKKCQQYQINGESEQRIQRLFLGYIRCYISEVIKSNIETEQKKKIISSICSDSIWNPIWRNYPIQSMPWKHRIFTLAQKHKSFIILFAITKLNR